MQVAAAPASSADVQISAGPAGVQVAAGDAADSRAPAVTVQASAPQRPAVEVHAAMPAVAESATAAPIVRRVAGAAHGTGGDGVVVRAHADRTPLDGAASGAEAAPAVAAPGDTATARDGAAPRDARTVAAAPRRQARRRDARGDLSAPRSTATGVTARGCPSCGGPAIPEALGQRSIAATAVGDAVSAHASSTPAAASVTSVSFSAGSAPAGPSAGPTAALAAAFAVLALLGCGRRLLPANAVRRRGPPLRPAARPG